MSVVSDHPLANGFAPAWADEWGQDEFGPWAAFTINEVQQILRWIPPGQFMMGSESADPDSDWTENECPRHWVQISRWVLDF